MSKAKFVILSTPSMNAMGDQLSRILTEKISDSGRKKVEVPHYAVEYTKFANGEILPKIPKTVRGLHVFLLAGLQYPEPNIEFMRMLITLNAIKYAHAKTVRVVLPFCSYLRQDRKDKPRVPITARLVADLMQQECAVKSVITADMHAEQIQGFFSIPVDNLLGNKVFIEYVSGCDWFRREPENVLVLAPDFGAAKRNEKFALGLGESAGITIPVGIVQKHRTGPNIAKVSGIMGPSVVGKIVVSSEDMICTGTTAIEVGKEIMAMGAKAFYLCATHAIFSRNAEERFRDSGIQVIATDTIPRDDTYYAEHASWLKRVSIVPYLADAMFETMKVGGSISKLYF